MRKFNTHPIVSIIVPVYNTADYLVKCIESIIQQKFPDWELILVDDGSTDSSPNIMIKYVKSDARIRSISSDAGCVSIARNMGMTQARGKYMYFIDSDDYVNPEGLDILVNTAIANPDVDFIQGSFSVLNIDTNNVVKSCRFESMQKFANKKMTGSEFLTSCGTTILYPFNSLISTQFLKERGISFPKHITHQEDTVFILSILLTNTMCMYVDNNGYVYRWKRPGSLTTGTQDDKVSNVISRKRLISAMIKSTVLLQGIRSNNRRVNKIINKIIIDNVTGCIGGASLLLPDREVFNQLCSSIKYVKIRSLGLRQILAFIYDISPELALDIRRLLN